MALKQAAGSFYNVTERPVGARLRKQRCLMAAIDKLAKYRPTAKAYDGVAMEIGTALKLKQISKSQAADLLLFIKECIAWAKGPSRG